MVVRRASDAKDLVDWIYLSEYEGWMNCEAEVGEGQPYGYPAKPKTTVAEGFTSNVTASQYHALPLTPINLCITDDLSNEH